MIFDLLIVDLNISLLTNQFFITVHSLTYALQHLLVNIFSQLNIRSTHKSENITKFLSILIAT